SVISDYDDGVIGKKFIDFIGCGKMSFEQGMEKFWAVIGAITKTPPIPHKSVRRIMCVWRSFI
ncbi:MAG: hypothetical protein IJJ55_02570, partial [Clostridia bacterium]|nr:hypothetical protein [Clostridia bacterium]